MSTDRADSIIVSTDERSLFSVSDLWCFLQTKLNDVRRKTFVKFLKGAGV